MAWGSSTKKMWQRKWKRRHDAREKRRKAGENIVPNRRLPQDRPRKPGAIRMTLGDVSRMRLVRLYEIQNLSSEDYFFLKRRGFEKGYYNNKSGKFVVEKDGEYYHGSGDTIDGWERL